MTSVSIRTIEELLKRPRSTHFWIEEQAESVSSGDPESFFYRRGHDRHLTFDMSNNMALANVSSNGAIRYLTFYRSSYRANPAGWMWPGVWVYKDFSRFGPYSFQIRTESGDVDLAKAEHTRTSLLDNVLPVTEIEGGDWNATLLTCAPISEDGKERPRGVIYGIYLANRTQRTLQGEIVLPRLFADRSKEQPEGEIDMSGFHPDEIEAALADEKNGFPPNGTVPFELGAGECKWIAALLYAPGEPFIEQINGRGSTAWIEATLSYYKQMTGRLTMPDHPFAAELFERSIHQCVQSIGMDAKGEIAGSNWGSYPPTKQIWMKDMYYSFLPLTMLQPELCRRGILWFMEYHLRPEGTLFQGGITHSLGNTLTPVLLAGLYYKHTGDRAFFEEHPRLKEGLRRILEEVAATRHDPEVWLFPSQLISDGDSVGDYHTGSNVCAWTAYSTMALLYKEVYGDEEAANRYAWIAGKIREALEEKTVVDGPFGRQYMEGVDADGTVPFAFHEGEETDTTLMPFYGYAPYDHVPYKNFTRFAMSEHNVAYTPSLKGIRWGMKVDVETTPLSCPSIMTNLANAVDLESFSGPDGALTEIRRLTDVDGSLWWWPYADKNDYGNPTRNNICGKCAWAAGVYASLFISDFLGVRYSPGERVLAVNPQAYLGPWTWDAFRFGNGTFSIEYVPWERLKVSNLNAWDVLVVCEGKELLVSSMTEREISL